MLKVQGNLGWLKITTGKDKVLVALQIQLVERVEEGVVDANNRPWVGRLANASVSNPGNCGNRATREHQASHSWRARLHLASTSTAPCSAARSASWES